MSAEPQATEPDTTQRRRHITWLVVALLSVQALIPLRYYLGFSGGDDERFSWRMFSTVRLQRCEMDILELRTGESEPQRLQLRPIVQVAWISILQRFRPSVVEAFMNFRCDQAGVEQVTYERRCLAPDNTSLPPNLWQMSCDARVMREVKTP